MKFVLIGVACGVSLCATPIFKAGNIWQVYPGNVAFGASNGSTLAGTVMNTGTVVDFSSPGGVLVTTSQGDVAAQDGLIHSVTISLAGGVSFGEIAIAPIAGPHSSSGATTVTALMADGSTSAYTSPTALSPNWNPLLVMAGGGPLIRSVTVSSAGGFGDLGPVRVSEIDPPAPGTSAVPEPGSMLLAGGGLLLLVFLTRRR